MKKNTFLHTVMLVAVFISLDAMADDVTGQLDGYYSSTTTITTQGTCTVESDAVAVLEAPGGIGLSPGFQTNGGSRFYAIIGQNGDSDANGLFDWWELLYFGTLGADPADDPDGDGLINSDECSAGTDPFDTDTDGDLMSDDYEVYNELNPLLDDADDDKDGDLYSNYVEYIVGTKPYDDTEVPIKGYYYQYDSRKRIKQVVYLPDTQIEYIIEYEYDNAGNSIYKIVSEEF